MPVEFTIENMGDHLSVVVKGSVRTLDDVLSFGTPFKDKTEETGIKHVLLDYRNTDIHMDYFDALLLAKHVESTKFTHRQLRIVHLLTPEQLPLFEEFKIPSLNRGFIFESFTDRDTALAWLRQQP